VPGSSGAQDVGGTNGDVAAQVSNTTITWAEGLFPQVTGVTSNPSYSLQLNSNFLNNIPVGSVPPCAGAKNPSACQGWEQFIYSSTTLNSAFIQYWLINYNNPCPAGWTTSGGNCFINSANAAPVPSQPLSNLGNLTLTGTAGASDTVTLAVNGSLYSVSQKNT